MKSTVMIYDPDRVEQALKTAGESIVAVKQVSIMIPARYVQRGLALFEDEISIVGYCAFIVDGNYYATSLNPAPFKTEPSSVMERIIDDVPQLELIYEPGALVISNVNVMMVDSLPYRIFDEFIAKGRLPWFIRERDTAVLFKNSKRLCGVELGANPAIFSIVSTNIYRDAENPQTFYRQSAKIEDPVIIPLRSTTGGGTNTMARMLGNYFEENMTGAIVYPSDRLEPGDRILRL